jgi:hypothetical protein
MKYPTMSASDATKYIESFRNGEHPSPATYSKWVGDSPRLSEDVIRDAVQKVRDVKDEYPEQLRPRDPKGGEFEIAAGEVFRKALDLPPEVAGDRNFWRYVAVVHMFDLITWRHPPDKGDFTALSNFGIGGAWENLAARMWYRFEVARNSAAEDPYELCRLGDQEIWRSHILRIRLGASRHIVRTFLEYQYPKTNERKPRLQMSSKKDVGIRLFVKRLQRFHATTAFEVLTEDDAFEIMDNLGKDLQSKGDEQPAEILH